MVNEFLPSGDVLSVGANHPNGIQLPVSGYTPSCYLRWSVFRDCPHFLDRRPGSRNSNRKDKMEDCKSKLQRVGSVRCCLCHEKLETPSGLIALHFNTVFQGAMEQVLQVFLLFLPSARRWRLSVLITCMRITTFVSPSVKRPLQRKFLQTSS